MSHTLRAEDGTPLEVKEGVILDREGNFVAGEERPRQSSASGVWEAYERQQARVRVWRPGSWVGFALAALAPFLLIAGFTVFAVFVAALLVFWLVRAILRAVGL